MNFCRIVEIFVLFKCISAGFHTLTIVNTRCNESMNKCLCVLGVEGSSNTTNLTEPIEAYRTNARNMLLKTKVRWHCDTKETHMVTGCDEPCSEMKWWSTADIVYRHRSQKKPEWWGYQMVEKSFKIGLSI